MAHLAFVVPIGLGHINPMAALARELVARGHRATFVHMADGEPILAKRGLAYHPVGLTTHPPGTSADIDRQLLRMVPPFGVMRATRRIAGISDMLCRELPGVLRTIQADMVVCDQVEPAGGLVADHLGLPHVSVAGALPINSEPAVPPLFVPWRYDPSPFGVKRNMAAYEAIKWVLRPFGEVIAHYANAWNLGPRRRIDQCLSRMLQVAQLVPGLDFPRERLWPVFHYCGPMRSAVEVTGAPALPPRDGRPLAYASLGSLQGARFGLFRRIAAGAQRCDLQLVLTHGGGLSADQVARLPGAPASYAFLPQAEVLREASVAVLHGGLNTILDACGQGVPLVVVPIAFEQGAIGRRVERAGAGLMVSHRLTSAAGLARAIRRVSEEPRYAQAAGRLREEIAAAGGARRAADLVELLLATGHPILAADRVRHEAAVSERDRPATGTRR